MLSAASTPSGNVAKSELGKMPQPSTSPKSQSVVEQTIERGFVLLRFPEPLEQAFVGEHARDRSFKLMVAGVNAAIIFGVVFTAVCFAAPNQMTWAFGLQLGATGPVVLLSLLALRQVSSPRAMEWMVVPVVTFASYIVAWDPNGTSTDLAFTKAAELFGIAIYVGVFARFWPMLVLSIPLFIMLVNVAMNATDVVGMNRPETCFLMFAVCFYALYACYTREHNDREAFLFERKETDLLRLRNEANQALQELARTDRLTGIANRRAFDEICAQYAGLRADLALLLIDIDHFKNFNDQYGHQAGDRCLCEVVEAIEGCLRRPIDIFARWGGEEFVVLIPDSDAAIVEQVAERICLAVSNRGIPHERSSCATCVTVSIGFAAGKVEDELQMRQLIQLADDALYQAKAQGRNRWSGRAPIPKPTVQQA
jgi:diguanylate cyclase (GGDEF)-like protein